jgi:hypothetical protein
MKFPILLLLCSLQAQAQQFREHTIATDLKGGYQVVLADLNKDGRPDIVALASGMTELVWFENPTWERHVIASGLKHMINVAALDTDGDGIPELLVAHEFANQAKNSIGIVSLLTHNGDPKQPWTVKEIDRLTTSHRLRIANGMFINAALTGAGAEAPDYRGHTPLVYYKPGEWKRHLISDANEGVVHGIYIVDWDGKGRDDILTASFTGIHLYRQDRAGKWTRTRIASGNASPWPKGGSSDVAVGRLGKQRFLCAIEPWHGNEVVVYTGKGKSWQRNVIDDKLVDGHTILTADLDGDGRDEIVAGYRGLGRSVFLYRNTASGWKRETLDNGGMAAAACAAGDLNGDKRIDIVCIGSATTNLKWYENVK